MGKMLLVLLTLSSCTSQKATDFMNALHKGNHEDAHIVREGIPMYDASECTGAVVAGICHGSIIPNTAVHPVCHGTVINGECTGPFF